MPEEKDRGVIKKEDDFFEIFKSFKRYHVDALTFKEILDEMRFNCVKVNEALYDQEYYGVLNRVCCNWMKCCCRRIRRRMVQGKIKEFNQEQRENKQKMVDMFTLVKQVSTSIVEALDLLTDVVLLN